MPDTNRSHISQPVQPAYNYVHDPKSYNVLVLIAVLLGIISLPVIFLLFQALRFVR